MSSSFISLAAIPPTEEARRLNSSGTAMVNVDGRPIQGGVYIAGTSGYDVAGMGAPQEKCAAFGLFCSYGTPGYPSEWVCSQNVNVLKQLNMES